MIVHKGKKMKATTKLIMFMMDKKVLEEVQEELENIGNESLFELLAEMNYNQYENVI